MKNVELESQIDTSVRTHFRSAKACTPKRANRRLGSIQERPDFSLIRDVQMRATGANIHAVAQQLQIYVSAIECGAMLHAQAVESQLRTFLATGR